MQRKLAFQFPHLLIKSVLGSGAWRFQRDLGGMKSPIRGPCFENPQHTDCTGVCRPFRGSQAMILGSTPAVRRAPPRQTELGGLHPGRREVSAVESGGSQTSCVLV
ncbi:unnamed protein product, partial [Staurois parvus]